MYRTIIEIINAQHASDGAGVKLKRAIGGPALQKFDPFLMLDEFKSDQKDDYIAGFPAHPHRGFETVTYMLAGKMQHQDHLGNQGLLQAGDVQWMTAARGIIHSEMPQQEEGLMHGFQLWLNLPSSNKLDDPEYQDIAAAKIPQIKHSKFTARVVAGTLRIDQTATKGYIQKRVTEPLIADVMITANEALVVQTEPSHRVYIYAYDGELSIAERTLKQHQIAVLGEGDEIKINASAGAKFLLLSGKPLGEPIAHWGPFVMNNHNEIEQAINQYRAGTLTD
ncbi:MAG: pirin family protein [Gammaproteobacteria bacterium]|nr:pirin family protein [Gammaproteobacteria bacterium]NVK89164.1 pirin family protein [Gammaproteobacteria bacterium]